MGTGLSVVGLALTRREDFLVVSWTCLDLLASGRYPFFFFFVLQTRAERLFFQWLYNSVVDPCRRVRLHGGEMQGGIFRGRAC